jgi:glyoxylase-like metal-dependent hydrolase (beta-lactamase superfamily II)
MNAGGAMRRTGDISIVSDGVAAYAVADVFPDVAPDVRTTLLAGRLLPDGSLPVPYSPLLVHTDGGPILVDAGAGEALAIEWGDPIGRTEASLAAAGVTPGDVVMVLITHAHADHVGGLTIERDGRRVPRYPNARHVISSAEWRYWVEGDHPAGFRAWLASLARLHLQPLRDVGLLELVDGPADVAPGVTVIPTPGHTPGHVSVGIRAGTTELLAIGDVVIHEWNFEHPEWTAVTETDRPLAVLTRRELLGRAVRDGSLVHAFHLATLGRVEAVGDRFSWVPVAGRVNRTETA